MSTYNFRGSINGPGNFGDHGKIVVNNGSSPAEAVRLAGELIRQLQAERPELVGEAQLLQGEIVGAEQEDRALDQGRVRGWLDTIQAGAGAGSAALALAQALGGAVGL
ncbi:hypothetical protein OG883_11045 [Streptomyces sp. NBC_01142]|uniref:hypothetical protein n=1 Tax=Streptomyces sp. NBC_01142 TaxID=2975865 RepID=UPI00224D7B5B|nr:hypothetical protein [Streptomyces sp. NBC_01142]MCX4820434.1 hypothetical protein [Streptomyces sp. NBC_01142]